MDEIKAKFNKRIEAPEPHMVSLVAEIDGIRGEFKSGLRMTPQAIASLRKSVLITSAGASTRIEGSTLSDEEVEKVLQGLTASKFAERDYQEVQGYLETLQNVFDSYEHLFLRESVIASLHNELLKYSVKDRSHRGKYKQKENIVGVQKSDGTVIEIVFATTPAWQTPKEMKELVDWTFEALETRHFHPLLVIANFLVEFLKIHPFEDGNGRLSRVLTNLLLLRAGYQFVQYVSHEKIIERRKEEYYLALKKSQNTFHTAHDTITPWLNFFLSVVKEQAHSALGLLQVEKFEDTLSPKQLEVWRYLVKVGETSPAEIAQQALVEITTVRKALGQFVKLGKVRRTGKGPGTRYVKI